MKTIIAAALVAFSVLATGVAQAETTGYPDWAKAAFENTW